MNKKILLLVMMVAGTSVNAMQTFQLGQSEDGRTDSANCSFSRQDEMVLLCSDGTYKFYRISFMENGKVVTDEYSLFYKGTFVDFWEIQKNPQ
ncbi:MAG: hypothetical protein LBJ96_05815 [Holosporaceae bacterium]|nr:hypothetical protein [Holosporaceae bacterium]